MENSPKLKETLYNKLCADESKMISGFDKLLGIKTSITETGILSGKYKKPIDNTISKIIFAPTIWVKATLIIGLLAFLAIMGGAAYTVYTNESANKSLTFIPILLCLGVFAIFYNPLFGKELNYTIEINHSGLIINHREFPWDDILSTYILRRPGKDEFYRLVLILNSEEVVIYHLKNFDKPGDIASELSAYIEHFRKG